MRGIEIYREYVPEHYEHTFSITIRSKNSERVGIEYDLVSALYDMIGKHPHLKDVKIIDCRKEVLTAYENPPKSKEIG